MPESKNVVIRFRVGANQFGPSKHTDGGVTRLSGLVEAKYLVDLLDDDKLLQANPREASRSAVTEGIRDSIESTPKMFPYKTKGILLGASSYRSLERNRYSLTFAGETEGLLDGGHNMLAIGTHFLRLVIVEQGEEEAEAILKKVRNWQSFLDLWKKYRPVWNSSEIDVDFLVPVEVLVPEDQEDENSVKSFRAELFEICAARNNNRQLSSTTKGNQQGFYEGIKAVFPGELVDEVEWKENSGGRIRVHDIIAMSWIPLTLLLKENDGKIVSKSGKEVAVVAPAPSAVYSRKGACVDSFASLARKVLGNPPRDEDETESEDFRQPFTDDDAHGAFTVLADLPRLHDLLYKLLPDAYNKSRGAFGRIRYVENPDDETKSGRAKNTSTWKTYYFQEPYQDYRYPLAYVMPLLYGLQSLMELDKNGRVVWAVSSPEQFIERNLRRVVGQYKGVMEELVYDPQKIGKSELSYATALNGFKSARRDEEFEQLKERVGGE